MKSLQSGRVDSEDPTDALANMEQLGLFATFVFILGPGQFL